MSIMSDMAWDNAWRITRHDDSCDCEDCLEIHKLFMAFPDAVAKAHEKDRLRWACYCGEDTAYFGHVKDCPQKTGKPRKNV